MEAILVSACLLGVSCRYDGKSKAVQDVISLMKEYTLIPICPEIMGGLPTPRPPAEICGKRVINANGDEVTEQYRRGAEEALRLARLYNCRAAILKEKSPSCGCGRIYDGTFKGILTAGDGITAELLKENGIAVFGEKNICLKR